MVANGSSGGGGGAILGPPPSSEGLAALLSASTSDSASPHTEPSTSSSSSSRPPRLSPTKASSLAPSPTKPGNGSGSGSGSGSRSNSSSSGTTKDTALLSSSHPHNLRKLARTGLEPSFSVKSYIGAASALLEKAKSDDAQGLAEQAFVNYLKSANVASSITKHVEWEKTIQQRGPAFYRYQDFMKNVPDIIQRANRLEELLIAREAARAEEAKSAVLMQASRQRQGSGQGQELGLGLGQGHEQGQTINQGRRPQEEDIDDSQGGGTDAADVAGFPAAAIPGHSPSPPASPALETETPRAATPALSSSALATTTTTTSGSGSTKAGQAPATLADRLSALRMSGLPSPAAAAAPAGARDDRKRDTMASIARRASVSAQATGANDGIDDGEDHLPPPPESPHRAPPELPAGLDDQQGQQHQQQQARNDGVPTESYFQRTYPALDDFESALGHPASSTGLPTPSDGLPPALKSPARPLPTPPIPSSSSSSSSLATAAGPSSTAAPEHALRHDDAQSWSLPQRTLVSVEELFTLLNPGFDTLVDAQGNKRMVRKTTSCILVADVRPRREYREMRIKGPDSFCIDPSSLVAGMSVQGIRHAMGSEGELAAFDARDSYDVVVLLDRDSRGYLGSSGHPGSSSMSHHQQQQQQHEQHDATQVKGAQLNLELLYRALTANSKTPVALLVGGIDRWARKVGDMGLVGEGIHVNGTSSSPSTTSSGRTSPTQQRMAVAATQDEELKRARRQGIYVADGPSMPARAYQSMSGQRPASTVGYALPSPLPRSLRPGEIMPSSVSRPTMASFDYPQLRGGPAPPPPAVNGTSSRGSSSTATATSSTAATAAAGQGRAQSMDLARRPLVPPPGGAPIASTTTPRTASYTTPGARQTQRADVRIGLTGLKNVGNSCYMNSTLQCLSATIPLARFLLEGSYKRAINHVNPLGTQGALAEAFAQLVRVMWSEQYTFVSPVTFREAITRFAPAFRGYDQHDAQEFLAFLLDGLHEDLNYVKQKPPPVDMTPGRELELETLPQQIASVKEWAIYRERNDSLIVDWFQGQFRNKLTCLTCGKTSTTYNAFMYLSLPIPATTRGQPRVTLTQCLDAFTRDEILDKADAWHCPRCKKPRKASKRLSISRLPQVLLIHLKRFSFKGPFTDKITAHVQVPTTNLDLTNYMPPPLPPGAIPKGAPVSASQQPPYVYDLYACVHHFGSLTGGHYTATIRTQGEAGPEWMYCDDSRVMKSDDRQINSPSPYLLFYFRRGR